MAARGDDKNLYAFKMTYSLLDLSTVIINMFCTSFRNFPLSLLSVAASNGDPLLGPCHPPPHSPPPPPPALGDSENPQRRMQGRGVRDTRPREPRGWVLYRHGRPEGDCERTGCRMARASTRGLSLTGGCRPHRRSPHA